MPAARPSPSPLLLEEASLRRSADKGCRAQVRAGAAGPCAGVSGAGEGDPSVFPEASAAAGLGRRSLFPASAQAPPGRLQFSVEPGPRGRVESGGGEARGPRRKQPQRRAAGGPALATQPARRGGRGRICRHRARLVVRPAPGQPGPEVQEPHGFALFTQQQQQQQQVQNWCHPGGSLSCP